MHAARPAFLLLTIVVCAAILAGATAGADGRQALPGDPTDPTRLPIGDGRVSTTGPAEGWIFACGIGTGGGALADGPWIKADGTFDLEAKATVDGAVTWPGSMQIATQGAKRTITSNGLPSSNEPTGIFPVQTTDDAYSYDRNPNTIAADLTDRGTLAVQGALTFDDDTFNAAIVGGTGDYAGASGTLSANVSQQKETPLTVEFTTEDAGD